MYHDPHILEEQEKFDLLVKKKASPAEREKFLRDFYVLRNRAIRDLDFQALAPKTIETDYLLPRRDVDFFILDNWIRHIFLPSLGKDITKDLFIFGLGRIFSKGNDIGVQCCTDADLNLVFKDDMPPELVDAVGNELDAFAKRIRDDFDIIVELHPCYTLQPESEILENMNHDDPVVSYATRLFYKSNERSIHVFKNHAPIRKKIFAPIAKLPDSHIFEHLLGLTSAKTTFLKLRADACPLFIIPDMTEDPAPVRTVIGSAIFAKYNRAVFGSLNFISPPEWHFSMKYTVNRVYDYVCAMRYSGYDLAQIGFGGDGIVPEQDPDYRFLRNAHKLMLYLQELLHLKDMAFGKCSDYSYVSKERFLRFMELGGEKFRLDFDELILSGELIPSSSQAKYLLLKKKIKGRVRDRFLEGPRSALNRFPDGFAYYSVHKDANTFRICVPYTWADLGYFVFTGITARIGQIVDLKILPAVREIDRIQAQKRGKK